MIVVWLKVIDKDMIVECLFFNGEVLCNYFLMVGYFFFFIVINVEVKDGILLFCGVDSEGWMIVLMLYGVKLLVVDFK